MTKTAAEIVAEHRAGAATPEDTIAQCYARIRAHADPAIFISLRDEADAITEGLISVDAVIMSAVMDTNTCDECEDVDGEVMELGDDRQLELHPPYVKCYGGDKCRCVQIALLSDGSEIDVDEVPEEAYE